MFQVTTTVHEMHFQIDNRVLIISIITLLHNLRRGFLLHLSFNLVLFVLLLFFFRILIQPQIRTSILCIYIYIYTRLNAKVWRFFLSFLKFGR